MRRPKREILADLEPEGGDLESAKEAYFERGGKITKAEYPENQVEIIAKVNSTATSIYFKK